jgi:hypothetical protein
LITAWLRRLRRAIEDPASDHLVLAVSTGGPGFVAVMAKYRQYLR